MISHYKNEVAVWNKRAHFVSGMSQKSNISTKMYRQGRFVTTLFRALENWKQPRCRSKDGSIDESTYKGNIMLPIKVYL